MLERVPAVLGLDIPVQDGLSPTGFGQVDNHGVGRPDQTCDGRRVAVVAGRHNRGAYGIIVTRADRLVVERPPSLGERDPAARSATGGETGSNPVRSTKPSFPTSAGRK